MSAHPIILGTAGHIDHGKTALVKVLTGIDTDRLKEEQRRGITIELGFAHLALGETRFGVVDVPGHERFIKSMVAGAGGLDLVMLVVAADEGVMPQTREHLDICQLLGVKRGLLALTKADLVDPEWLQLVQEDLREFLSETFLAEAPLIPCSAVSGLGLAALRQTLAALADQVSPRDPNGLLRLPLDRVFSLKGFGTIVTGTLLSGTLQLGQEVLVAPGEIAGKARSIQVHGAPVERAVAGQRTAVNLGGVDRHAVARGEVLVHPGTLAPSAMIDVELQLLPGAKRALPRRSKVLFHLGTRQQEATCVLLDQTKLEPGAAALAQLRFTLPVVALPGDRFILRGFVKQENYGTTMGGGEVLRVLSRRLRPRDSAALELLRCTQAADSLERVALEVQAAGPVGLTRLQLQQRLPFVPAELDRLLSRLFGQGTLIRFDKDSGAVVHAQQFQRLLERSGEIVDRFHQENPLAPGIAREELRSRLGRGVDSRLFFALLQALAKTEQLVVERELCYRPGHTVQAAGISIQALAASLESRFRQAALGPPREAELPTLLEQDAEPKVIAAALKLLSDEGTLVRAGGLFFHREAIRSLEQQLRDFLEREGEINAAQFKEMVGQSRKFSIPLAEHFDAKKVTLRIGDVRKLRR